MATDSLEVGVLDEALQLGHGHALFVAVLRLRHSLLDNRGDLFRGLCQHLVHVLCHRVHVAQVFQSRLSCLCVGVERRLVLLEELLLDSDVVVRDAKHNESVFRLARLLGQP